MSRKTSKNDAGISRENNTVGNEALRYTADFKRFANVELNADDKEHFIVWASANNFFEVMEKHGKKGRTLNVKRDFKQQCYLATSLERDNLSSNAGVMVSARARTPDMALWRLLYILDAFFDGKEWESYVDISDDKW